MPNPLELVLSRNRHFLLFAFLFSLFVNVLMLTGPLFMLQVYDRVLGSRLMHRVALELVAVIACHHVGLLASKLESKASTNLGALSSSNG